MCRIGKSTRRKEIGDWQGLRRRGDEEGLLMGMGLILRVKKIFWYWIVVIVA